MTLDFVDAHASLVYNMSLWLHFAHYMIHRTMFNGLCLCSGGGIRDSFTCLSGSWLDVQTGIHGTGGVFSVQGRSNCVS